MRKGPVKVEMEEIWDIQVELYPLPQVFLHRFVQVLHQCFHL